MEVCLKKKKQQLSELLLLYYNKPAASQGNHQIPQVVSKSFQCSACVSSDLRFNFTLGNLLCDNGSNNRQVKVRKKWRKYILLETRQMQKA